MVKQIYTLVFVGLDPNREQAMERAMAKEGGACFFAKTAAHAFDFCTQNDPDLVVLDEILGDVRSLLHTIRQRTSCPVVVLMRGCNAAAEAAMLAAGADDLILRSCALPELTARLHAHLRRALWNKREAAAEIVYGAMRLDCQNDQLWTEGDGISLTPVESHVLAYLLPRADRMVPKLEVAKATWGWGKSIDQIELLNRVIVRLCTKLASVPWCAPILTILQAMEHTGQTPYICANS